MFILNQNMFSYITDRNIMLHAWKLCNRGKLKYKRDALFFNANPACYLYKLRERILNGTYVVSDYKEALIKDSKKRKIAIPNYKDKIVHHMVNLVLREYYEPMFIPNTYACIRQRGNKYAVLKLQEIFQKYPEAYLLKLDITQFFYSIDKNILFNILQEDISCKYTLNLLRTIIFSYQPNQVGLPLGNLTSQLFANILLNKFDHYVYELYGVLDYLRYADDMFIFCKSKDIAKNYLKYLSNYLLVELKLTVNPIKCYIHNLAKENKISGLGFNIYKDKILLNSYIKRRFKYHVKHSDLQAINSVLGHMKIATHRAVVKKILKNTKYKYVNNKIILKENICWK